MLKRIFYHIYRLSSSIAFWLRRRSSPAAYLLLGALCVFAAVGLDTNLTMAHQGFAFLGSLLMISFTWSVFSRAKFNGRRLLPRFGTAGIPLPYRVSLENLTPRPQRNLLLLEALTDPRPSLSQFLGTAEPGESRRNWFDRACGYYRWSWHVHRNLPARRKDLAIDSMPARSQITLQHEFTPRRRGVMRLQDLVVAWPDPLGLFRSLHKISCPQSVLILPKRYPVRHVTLPGTRQYQPGGVALASAIGESHEFVGLRDYRPGDPIRNIHWRSLAKFGKPIIKEFQDEFFVRHALVLDTFSPQGEDEVFEEAVSVAASFACTIPEQESLLDLLFVGTQAYCFTAGRSLASIESLLEVLASITPCETSNFAALENLVVRHTTAMTGCICIFVAWDEPRIQLVRRITTLGIPVLTLVITANHKQTSDVGRANVPASHARVHWLQTGNIAQGLAQL